MITSTSYPGNPLGDVFLTIDADQARTDVEVEAIGPVASRPVIVGRGGA
jgi:hypothetical protein